MQIYVVVYATGFLLEATFKFFDGVSIYGFEVLLSTFVAQFEKSINEVSE